ncbi:MAG: amidohydrolase, partial [Hyphomonas sp. 32-62-5]
MILSRRFLRTAAVAAISIAAAFPAMAETVIIHAGKVLDVPGNAVRGATTITVTDGKIVSLENGHKAAPNRSVRVIDLKDSFVLPGLIDSHVHLTSDTGGIAGQLEEITLSPAAQGFDAWTNGMKTLNAGFTTVRNLGDGDGAVLALRDAINDGQMQGPRILDAAAS